MAFAGLHIHSHYSLLDGFGSPKALAERAKELGYTALALTDHGNTHGLIEFYKACKELEIKPVLGCEVYVSPRTRFDKDPALDTKPYHLILLAENDEGYKNLLELVTIANLEGFYYKPRIDFESLEKYKKGLIATSACLAGEIPRAIINGDMDKVEAVVLKYLDVFGKNNFFLEIQDHPEIDEQAIVNRKISEIAKKHDISLVCATDTHYPRPEDKDAHEVMLCIQTGTTIDDPNRMSYPGDFSLRSIENINEVFKDFPEAIENTVKIAERCNYNFQFGVNLIPSFDCPDGKSPELYLRELVENGLKARFEKLGTEIPNEYIERIDFELSIINKMGFDTYFLIVQDFMAFAREAGIIVGPGRGSAAGALISYCLQITNVDPIKYGLLFERFLNPERVSMPDIDIDFTDTRRDEVIKYVSEKYGRENVAQIITFGTMAPRAAIRDVGRALGYPYSEVDKLAKLVPPPVLGKTPPIAVSIKNDPELKKEYDENPRSKKLYDLASRLEGSVRHTGTHACAVVISEKKLTHYTALQYGAGQRSEIVTQYSAKPLEDLGLLKMDFLGLRNLTIIETACRIIQRTRGIEVKIDDIPMDDKLTFELFQRGDTTGVFQFESPGMRRYLKELKPTEFDDIFAMAALYRPGPMEWIPHYIKGKHNPDSVTYLHNSFASILSKTYGVAIYQEQILQLARDFAGFSLGQADMLRKAVGKKIPALLAEQKEKFIKGAIDNGFTEDFAKEVFEKVVEPFAGYGFNKSHAVCYALIAYQTAYLKAHYPIEFMTGLLSSDANNMDRVVLEIKECVEKGIEVLPPSINESLANFTCTGENSIRFGLLAIKGIGEGPVNEIIEERKRAGKFLNLADLAKRVSYKILNKKFIQSAALSGALDDFGNRNQISESFEEISSYARNAQTKSDKNQSDIFGVMDETDANLPDLKLKDVPMSTHIQHLKFEKELLGMFVSGHPLHGLNKFIKKKGVLISDLKKKDLGEKFTIIGMVNDLRVINTKNGDKMAVFVVEDPTAKINAVVFPKSYSSVSAFLSSEEPLIISGKFDFNREEYQIIVDKIKKVSLNSMILNAKEEGIFDEEAPITLTVPFLSEIIDKKIVLEKVVEFRNSSVFIKIPKNCSKEKMKALSLFLEKQKGENEVFINLPNSSSTIQLSVKIDFTVFLANQIEKILI
jgi:DNA polymerase III subunit alpha